MIHFIFFTFSLFAQDPTTHHDLLPKGNCDQVVNHSYYSLCYSYEHQQASWTTHYLTQESISGRQRRTNDFRRDHSVENPIGSRDFKGSGYDRGHLVPAGDMKLNHTSMSESFFMTNMSPQNSNFNRGRWRSLETFIRGRVKRWGNAYVVTAPLLAEGLKRIWSGVSIPDFYYKIAYFPEEQIMIAYFMPNKRLSGHKLEEFVITVDKLEELTGFDFFSELPDELEDMLESELYDF